MNKILLLLLMFLFCKKNEAETKFKQAIRENDFLAVAGFCSEYKFDKYEKECSDSLEKSILEIEKIIAQKKELPFMKLIINKETSKKIDNLLKYNIHLGIKYRSIWNETAEQYPE